MTNVTEHHPIHTIRTGNFITEYLSNGIVITRITGKTNDEPLVVGYIRGWTQN